MMEAGASFGSCSMTHYPTLRMFPSPERLLLAARDDDDRARPHLAGMFVIAPVLLVFAVAQRQIIRAFTFASLK